MLFVPFFCISTLQSTQFIRLLYSAYDWKVVITFDQRESILLFDIDAACRQNCVTLNVFQTWHRIKISLICFGFTNELISLKFNNMYQINKHSQNTKNIENHNFSQQWPRLGWPWFGWAASQLGAGGMGASFDITDDNPTHIYPLPVFPTKLKAILTFAI